MSYCDCDWDDYDPPAFYRAYEVKRTKKRHYCEECGAKTIAPGEPCRVVTGKWYDQVDTFRTCARCVELKQWAQISMPCFCSLVGELHERVQEMVQDVAPKVPGFFYEYGRRMVQIRRLQRSAVGK